MIRNNLGSIVQNKNILMFATAIIFMAGILCYFNDTGILISALLTIAGVFLIWKNYVPSKYVLFGVLVFYIGFFNTYFRVHETDALVNHVGNKITVKGQIVSIPNSNGGMKSKFFFKVFELGDNRVNGKTFVSVEDFSKDFSEFKIGDFYEIEGSLKTPFKAGNPSQFDYGKYLRNYNAYTVFYAKKIDCKRIDKKLSVKWKFLRKLNVLRDNIIETHSKYLKSPNLEIIGGIVFGDDAVAPPDYIKTSFVNSGLLHILAASGMNVAFIYGFWVFFMRRIRAPFQITVISGIFLIILYTLMTGLGASVIRAALMLILVLIGKLIDRDANSVSLLAFVALLMLIYNPAYINDVGFQLSFIVTFGLLTTANVIFEKYKDSKFISWGLSLLLIPLVAQIWVAPIQMFYFNTFSTYSVLANVCSMPFLSVVSFGGFVSSIFAMFTPFADKICMILDFVMNYFLNAIVWISKFFGNLQNSIISTTHPSVFQILIYYILILALTFAIKTGITKKILTICSILLISLLLSTINIPSKNLEVITFDVQNADCFLIKTPKNKYFIIDTGRAGYMGGKAQANSIIIKYLKDRGIKNIEGMVITHFDNDHSGGAVDIMKNFVVKNVYLNSFDDKTMTSVDIYKAIRDRGISAKIPNENIYEEKDLKITTFISNVNKDNEKSIITVLKYNDFEMLFMGDAGIKAYENLQDKIPQNIEIFKVGHHGGFRVVNEEMLIKLNPEVSIISTGANSFGHPNRRTLDILRNTDIYRTDRQNSIKATVKGNEYKIYLYNPLKHRYELSKKYYVKS